MTGKKTYPDLRYLFLRGLIDHESRQRARHYLKSAAEWTSRAIVSLELADTPVKSVKQAQKLEGIGGETCARLTKLDKERNFSSIRPLGGRFVSSAGGILIALAEAVEDAMSAGHRQDRPVLIPEDRVRGLAQNLSEETFITGPDEGFCKAWWRLEVLIKRGYIKRRSHNKTPVLELLPLGKQVVELLRERVGLPARTAVVPKDLIPVTPAADERSTKQTKSSRQNVKQEKTTLASLQSREATAVLGTDTSLEDALYTNDTGEDGVVLLVDVREMGGDRQGLGQLCLELGTRGLTYKTRSLSTGDYGWFWRSHGQEVSLPCLIERKRADDVARTLKEGRFWSQVWKMVAWKQQFSEINIPCHLHYVVEGRPEQYLGQCTDGCLGVGGCGNPSLTQVQVALDDLRKHPQLQVKQTDNLHTTIALLASFTAELTQRVSKGDFDTLLKKNLLVGPDNKNQSQYLLKEKVRQRSTHDTEYSSVRGDNTGVGKVCKQEARNTETCNRLENQTVVESADLDFERELELAIKLSKSEQETDDVIDISVKGTEAGSENVIKLESDDDDDVTLQGEPESEQDQLERDIAVAIERSKQDMLSIHKERSARYSDAAVARPLMQYHCSEGGSIIYPSKTASTCELERGDEVSYFPKMNFSRKRPHTAAEIPRTSQDSDSDIDECSEIQDLTADRVAGLNKTKVVEQYSKQDYIRHDAADARHSVSASKAKPELCERSASDGPLARVRNFMKDKRDYIKEHEHVGKINTSSPKSTISENVYDESLDSEGEWITNTRTGTAFENVTNTDGKARRGRKVGLKECQEESELEENDETRYFDDLNQDIDRKFLPKKIKLNFQASPTYTETNTVNAVSKKTTSKVERKGLLDSTVQTSTNSDCDDERSGSDWSKYVRTSSTLKHEVEGAKNGRKIRAYMLSDSEELFDASDDDRSACADTNNELDDSFELESVSFCDFLGKQDKKLTGFPRDSDSSLDGEIIVKQSIHNKVKTMGRSSHSGLDGMEGETVTKDDTVVWKNTEMSDSLLQSCSSQKTFTTSKQNQQLRTSCMVTADLCSASFTNKNDPLTDDSDGSLDSSPIGSDIRQQVCKAVSTVCGEHGDDRREWEGKVDTITSVLPQVSREVALVSLRRWAGDVEACLSNLLEHPLDSAAD